MYVALFLRHSPAQIAKTALYSAASQLSRLHTLMLTLSCSNTTAGWEWVVLAILEYGWTTIC